MACCLLAPVAWAVFFKDLGSYSLVNGDEAFYQGVAEGMVESGDWLSVRFRGQPRARDAFLNAPYHYWARATLISWFGSSLWTARFLAAAFSSGLLFVACWWTARLAGAVAGLVCGLLVLTTYQLVFLHGARTGELEPLVAFFLLLSAATFARAIGGNRSFVPHHLCLLALMGLKSPLVLVALIADLGVLTMWPAARPLRNAWMRAGLLVLPLGLLWPAIQVWRLGDGAWTGIRSLLESAAHGAEERTPGRHVTYYARWLAAGAFPWSLVVPLALVHWVRTRGREAGPAAILVYPIGLLIFYLLVEQRFPWYVIPIYPFLAIIVATWLRESADRTPSLWVVITVAATLSLALLLRADPADLNPVAQRAMSVDLRLAWRPGAGVAGALGLATLLAVLVWLGRRALGRAAAPAIVAAVTVVLVSVGGVRIASGLRGLDHRSRIAEIRLEIDRQLLAGEPIDFPIVLPPDGHQAIYYFGDEFMIRFREGRAGAAAEPAGSGIPVIVGLRRAYTGGGEIRRAWLEHPGRIR